MNKSLIVILIAVCFSTSCRKNEQVSNTNQVFADSVLGLVVADTIIYDVDIVNMNLEDQWASYRLYNLDRKLMLDNIYDLVYSGRASAYDHTTGEKLTGRQVENLEKTEGFSREDVDMIQFKEVWYMNPVNNTITKQVISLVLGAHVFANDGQFLANRAIMRVELRE